MNDFPDEDVSMHDGHLRIMRKTYVRGEAHRGEYESVGTAYFGPVRVVEFNNRYDKNGDPAGGYASGVGLEIKWQDGPVNRLEGEKKDGLNGTFVEDVLEAVAQRLEFYQKSRFACKENAYALDDIRLALARLMDRRKDRQKRGVEGKHEA